MSKDFVPTNESVLKAWLENMKTQVQNNPTSFGLSMPDTQSLLTCIDQLNNSIADVSVKADQYKSAVRLKDQLKTTLLPQIRQIIGVIKANPDYSDSMGVMLGVTPRTGISTDWDSVKPVPKAKKTMQGVEISYKLKGATGVLVYGKRGTESDFILLEKDTASPFVDKRANQAGTTGEQRQYYMVYFRKDEPVGQPSDIVTIVV